MQCQFLALHENVMEAKEIGRAIQRLRVDSGWSVYRLATKAGVSDVYLGDIEEGKTKRPGIAIIARVARALGVTVDELLMEAGLLERHDEGHTVPVALLQTYRDLAPPQRQSLLRIGRVLKEQEGSVADSHADYDAQQPLDDVTDAEEAGGGAETRKEAAFDQTDQEEEAYRDTEPGE